MSSADGSRRSTSRSRQRATTSFQRVSMSGSTDRSAGAASDSRFNTAEQRHVARPGQKWQVTRQHLDITTPSA